MVGVSRQIKGKTVTAEEGMSTESVSIFWSDPVEQFAVRGFQSEFHDTMIMAIDRHEGNAR